MSEPRDIQIRQPPQPGTIEGEFVGKLSAAEGFLLHLQAEREKINNLIKNPETKLQEIYRLRERIWGYVNSTLNMDVTLTDFAFNNKVIRDQVLMGAGVFGSFLASLYVGIPLFVATKDPHKKLHYHEEERERTVQNILKLREELGRINAVATEVLRVRGPAEEGYYNNAYEELTEPYKRHKI